MYILLLTAAFDHFMQIICLTHNFGSFHFLLAILRSRIDHDQNLNRIRYKRNV